MKCEEIWARTVQRSGFISPYPGSNSNYTCGVNCYTPSHVDRSTFFPLKEMLKESAIFIHKIEISALVPNLHSKSELKFSIHLKPLHLYKLQAAIAHRLQESIYSFLTNSDHAFLTASSSSPTEWHRHPLPQIARAMSPQRFYIGFRSGEREGHFTLMLRLLGNPLVNLYARVLALSCWNSKPSWSSRFVSVKWWLVNVFL